MNEMSYLHDIGSLFEKISKTFLKAVTFDLVEWFFSILYIFYSIQYFERETLTPLHTLSIVKKENIKRFCTTKMFEKIDKKRYMRSQKSLEGFLAELKVRKYMMLTTNKCIC